MNEEVRWALEALEGKVTSLSSIVAEQSRRIVEQGIDLQRLAHDLTTVKARVADLTAQINVVNHRMAMMRKT